MRLALAASVVVALVLLAGCAQPGAEEDDDPLFGLCPQWAQGHGLLDSFVLLDPGNATASRELGPADATFLNRPLDLYRVRIDRIDANGTVTLRASAADGARLSIRDYREADLPVVPVVHLDAQADGHEFDVFLSPVLDAAPAAIAPATLSWTLEGANAVVEYTVTYHYKVCGA